MEAASGVVVPDRHRVLGFVAGGFDGVSGDPSAALF